MAILSQLKKHKRIVSLLLIPVIVFAIIYWVGYWVISTEWQRNFSKNQVLNWATEINNTAPISENFISIFDTLFPSARQNSIRYKYKDLVFKHLLGGMPSRSWGNYYSQITADLILSQKKNMIWDNFFEKTLVLAYGLEYYASPSKCVDFYLKNVLIQYPINQKDTFLIIQGIENLSQFKFGKNISELSEDEVIEIIISIDYKRAYLDRFHNSTLFEKRKKQLKRMLRGSRALSKKQ